MFLTQHYKNEINYKLIIAQVFDTTKSKCSFFLDILQNTLTD
jgi:hypothetical protein